MLQPAVEFASPVKPAGQVPPAAAVVVDGVVGLVAGVGIVVGVVTGAGAVVGVVTAAGAVVGVVTAAGVVVVDAVVVSEGTFNQHGTFSAQLPVTLLNNRPVGHVVSCVLLTPFAQK